MNSIEKKYALLSVSDKTGIVELAKTLVGLGYEIISTGGTAKTLAEASVAVVPIQDITGNPESFGGRMKTISFQIESGILFDRENSEHVRQAQELNIKPIDIVVCNLYPFEQTAARAGAGGPAFGGIEAPANAAGSRSAAAERQTSASEAQAIENIDVGGPTMVRAAAKNFKNVLVIVDPADYQAVGKMLQAGSMSHGVSLDERRRLAAKAFAHLSFYDAQVADYFRHLGAIGPDKEDGAGNGAGRGGGEKLFPAEITLPGRKAYDLRYGENPHQKGAVYFTPGRDMPLQHLRKVAGRELSLMNLTYINAGLEVVRLFSEPAAVVIKHNNPCGIALGSTAAEALARAIEADPESAFGGGIVLNKDMDAAAAKIISQFKDERRGNIDIVAAPEISAAAAAALTAVRKTMGLYSFGPIQSIQSIQSQVNSPPDKSEKTGVTEGRVNLKWIDGGFVLQEADDDIENGFDKWEVVTQVKPTPHQLKQMQLAWKFITRTSSNAIIIVDKDLPMTWGIGTGQTSRVRSVKIALEQAGEKAKGAILASDSFFPFDDSVKLAAAAGIAAIVQQGDSINDKASIAAADAAGMAMVLTHRRAFWH